MKKFIYLSFLLLQLSCEQNRSAEEQIYDIMDFVITDQELDRRHGLKLEAETRYSLDETTEELLNDLIESPAIESPASSEATAETKFELKISDTFYVQMLTKCLTKSDVKYMLQQRENNKGFKWNNSKLRFNLNNKEHWYALSVPLISKDGTKALIMIRDLCAGLCGRGWTLLLKKENGKWTSERGASWWH